MRRLNVKLLIWLAAPTVLLLIGIPLLHGHQVKKSSATLLTQAQDAEKAGDLRKAVKYYGQYLKMKDDADAYAALATAAADLAEKRESNQQDVIGAYKTLEQAVRQHPDLHAIRRRLVDFAMKIGLIAAAKEHIEFLQAADQNDTSLDVRYAQCLLSTGEEEKATRNLEKLIGFDEVNQQFAEEPVRGVHEIDAYTLLADIVRLRKDDPARAKIIMDGMVTANPNSYKAYLERGRYRRELRHFKDAQRDLGRALKLAPDNVSVILMAAEIDIIRKDFDKAEALLDNGIKLHPTTEGLYRARASLILNRDNKKPPREVYRNALAEIQKGLAAAPDAELLIIAQADMQTQQNDMEGLKQSIKLMQDKGLANVWIEYFTARVLFGEKKWHDAAAKFERIRLVLRRMPDLAIKLNLALCQCYESMGEPDRELEASNRALELDPRSESAKVYRSRAYIAMQRLNKVKEELEGPQSRPVLTTIDVSGSLISVEIDMQLAKPPGERDWKETDRYLEELLKNKKIEEPRKVALKSQVLLVKGQADEAREMLIGALRQWPDDQSVWLAWLNVSAKTEEPLETLAKIDEAQQLLGDQFPLRLARINCWSRIGGDDAKQNLAKLENDVDKLTLDQQITFWSEISDAYLRQVDSDKDFAYDNMRRCRLKMSALQPDNARIVQSLFDMAMDFGKEADMQATMEKVKELSGSGALYKYCQTSLLIWQVREKKKEKPALADARGWLKEANKLRPEWHELPRLAAEIDELQGRYESAITNYQKVQELGKLSSFSARRLVMLLFARGRYEEAQKALRFLSPNDTSELLEQIKVSLALHEGELGQALDLAKKMLEANKDNINNQLWYGQMLEQANQHEEAEAVFREAIKKSPETPQVWLTFVDFLVTSKRSSEAAEVIQQAEEALKKDDKEITLAQIYDILGDAEAAERHYLAALKASPDDFSLMRRIAAFQMRMNEPDKVQEMVDLIVAKSENAGQKDGENVAWARRAMAQKIAGQGSYQKLQEARELIHKNPAPGGLRSVDDLLLESTLLANRPDRASRAEALRLLEQLQVVRGSLSNDEQLVMAQLYDQTGQWGRARDEMLSLLGRASSKGDAHRSYLAYVGAFCNMLLQHDELTDAQTWIEVLRKMQPNFIVTVEMQAKWLAKQDKADQAERLLQSMVPFPLKPGDLPRLGTVATLLEDIGLHESAEKELRLFAEQEPRAQLSLATFLGRHGNLDEAFQLFEESRKSQALSKIIQSAVGALRVRRAEASQQHFDAIDQWIQAALAADDLDPQDAVNLQLETAEARDLQGRYAEVVKIYRGLLANPAADFKQQAVIRNNLAFLLAVRRERPGDLDEALKLSDEAVASLGPIADLLDTQGVIYLAKDDVKQALTVLETAAADTPSITRYFHLAQARLKNNDRAGAAAALEKAQELKPSPGEPPGIEAKSYEQLLKQLGVQPK